MAKRISITGGFLRSTPLDVKHRIAGGLRRQVWPLLGTSIRLVIDAVYPLSDAAVAHARMERNAHIGKIMLAINRSMPA